MNINSIMFIKWHHMNIASAHACSLGCWNCMVMQFWILNVFVRELCALYTIHWQSQVDIRKISHGHYNFSIWSQNFITDFENSVLRPVLHRLKPHFVTAIVIRYLCMTNKNARPNNNQLIPYYQRVSYLGLFKV